MEVEETIANSRGNRDELVLALQGKLRDFGLTKNESKIFVFLSKNGPKKAIEISSEEKIPRTETYHLLSTLQQKGIIFSIFGKPTKFNAVGIEESLSILVNNEKNRITELDLGKESIIKPKFWIFSLIPH